MDPDAEVMINAINHTGVALALMSLGTALSDKATWMVPRRNSKISWARTTQHGDDAEQPRVAKAAYV